MGLDELSLCTIITFSVRQLHLSDKAPGEQLLTLVAIHTPAKKREIPGNSRFKQ